MCTLELTLQERIKYKLQDTIDEHLVDCTVEACSEHFDNWNDLSEEEQEKLIIDNMPEITITFE